MDIRKFAVAATSRLHLRDASDELMYADEAKTLPIAVTIFGPGSKQHAAAQAKQSNLLVNLVRKKGDANQTAEQRREAQAEFLTACTESFENLEYGELQGLELAKAVYSDLSLGFIADQVAKHLGEWSNFSKGSTNNSPSTSDSQRG